jgi:catechol 2,3-dioxygenase-like lactoylglutathione lyase family enzyme
MRPPIPILRSFDEAKTREFWVGFLGFEVLFEHRFEPGTPLYLGLRRGDCVVHVSEHHGDACPGSSMRVEVPDVDALRAELLAKQYRHARPGVQDQPWGTRDMTIGDPSGNRITFYTPLR